MIDSGPDGRRRPGGTGRGGGRPARVSTDTAGSRRIASDLPGEGGLLQDPRPPCAHPDPGAAARRGALGRPAHPRRRHRALTSFPAARDTAAGETPPPEAGAAAPPLVSVRGPPFLRPP